MMSSNSSRNSAGTKKQAAASKRRRPKWAVSAAAESTTIGEDGPYFMRSIARALDLLEAFDENHITLTLRDLSRIIGAPESSAFRMVVTLQSRGYLHQNEDGSYQLAPRLLYGKVYEIAERFRTLARSELQALAGHFNENASLAFLFGERIQVVDSVDSLHEIRITNRPGRVLPPHCSAMGKAITAFQSRELIDRILETYGLTPRTPRSMSNRRELMAQLEEVRQTGIAYDREESTLGGICVGAAIQMESGPVLAAISVSTPIARMTSEREDEIAAGVFQTAAAISRKLRQMNT